eukprot:TRINITY_DN62784_c0_g1_i1.p1 TRINITY_DN62784_c0_g1~~TRINITY_DN62784_c0_g1_i1.p1  ORF type:complete len:278 (+),score=86.88 TRINITY_DN62784_c0_g1_i1:250-1083(+)
MEAVVETLFAELMVLGFIGLISFSVSKSGVLKTLSRQVYNCEKDKEEGGGRQLLDEYDECLDKVSEAFETLHMMLFLTMVLFLCQVLLFVFLGLREQGRWRRAEKKARIRNPNDPSESLAVAEYRELRDSRRGGDGVVVKPNHWNPCEYFVWSEWWESRYAWTYSRMRSNFISPPYDTKAAQLPTNFAYHHYLAERMGVMVAEIVEVPISTWVGLEVMLCCFLFVLVAIKEDIQSLIFIWLGIEYVLLLVYVYLWKKLLWIKSMLGGHGLFLSLIHI